MTIIQFLSDILGIPSKYEFITYIVGSIIVLILLDGVISFLFGGLTDLTSRRR